MSDIEEGAQNCESVQILSFGSSDPDVPGNYALAQSSREKIEIFLTEVINEGHNEILVTDDMGNQEMYVVVAKGEDHLLNDEITNKTCIVTDTEGVETDLKSFIHQGDGCDQLACEAVTGSVKHEEDGKKLFAISTAEDTYLDNQQLESGKQTETSSCKRHECFKENEVHNEILVTDDMGNQEMYVVVSKDEDHLLIDEITNKTCVNPGNSATNTKRNKKNMTHDDGCVQLPYEAGSIKHEEDGEKLFDISPAEDTCRDNLQIESRKQTETSSEQDKCVKEDDVKHVNDLEFPVFAPESCQNLSNCKTENVGGLKEIYIDSLGLETKLNADKIQCPQHKGNIVSEIHQDFEDVTNMKMFTMSSGKVKVGIPCKRHTCVISQNASHHNEVPLVKIPVKCGTSVPKTSRRTRLCNCDICGEEFPNLRYLNNHKKNHPVHELNSKMPIMSLLEVTCQKTSKNKNKDTGNKTLDETVKKHEEIQDAKVVREMNMENVEAGNSTQNNVLSNTDNSRTKNTRGRPRKTLNSFNKTSNASLSQKISIEQIEKFNQSERDEANREDKCKLIETTATCGRSRPKKVCKISSQEEKKFACTLLCGKTFSTPKDMRQHRKTHMTDKIFLCDLCNKSFATSSSLNQHKQTHIAVKPHQCHICGKAFTQKGNMMTHLRLHTGEKPYTCRTCSRPFHQKSTYIAHCFNHCHDENVISNIKLHTCKVCNKSFAMKSNLDVHERIHSGTRPYKCTQCEKDFISSSCLLRHMRIHTREGMHKCSFCDKMFIQKSAVKVHMQIHTKDKRFNCDECDKKFITRGQLMYHSRTHTGEKPLECKICGSRFAQHGTLANHQKNEIGCKGRKKVKGKNDCNMSDLNNKTQCAAEARTIKAENNINGQDVGKSNHNVVNIIDIIISDSIT